MKTNAGTNYLTMEEEKQLWKTMSQRKGWKAEKDFVLLKTMRLLALRRVETIRLNIGHIENKTALEVTKDIAAKGGIGTVYICAELQEIFSIYLKAKRKRGDDVSPEAPLFLSFRGTRLSERGVNEIVRYWCEEAGLPAYTPHAFRHTKAQRIMADMKNIPEDQREKKLIFANNQLRHQSLNSTAVYTQPSKEDMTMVGEI